MSFAGEVKTELCRAALSRKCCAQAECYGILLYCNTYTAEEIRIITESDAFAQRLPALFKKAFKLTFDRLPEGEPDATLYYSDTSVMRLWRYPLKRSSSGRWEGVFISFVSLDGTTYSYYTDRTDWQNISWPLSPESNAPWSN